MESASIRLASRSRPSSLDPKPSLIALESASVTLFHCGSAICLVSLSFPREIGTSVPRGCGFCKNFGGLVLFLIPSTVIHVAARGISLTGLRPLTLPPFSLFHSAVENHSLHRGYHRQLAVDCFVERVVLQLGLCQGIASNPPRSCFHRFLH